MSPPAVTVVTPVFDGAEHLEHTARSLTAQTFQAFEWVIVDDGSVDPMTQALIDRASRTVRRCRVVRHNRNQGPAAARNSGFAEAEGDLVMQLDADDLLEPTALDKLYWHLAHHPDAAFAKGHTAGFGAESYIWVNGFDEPERFLDQNQADSMAMIRRSAHSAVGGYDPEIRDGLEDWEFWLRCAAAGQWGSTVPEVLGWYRRRPDHGSRWANWDGSEREAEFRELMRRRYPRLWSRGMPQPPMHGSGPSEAPAAPGGINRLRPLDRRLLFVVGTPGDPFQEDLAVRCVASLSRSGWECVVALLAPSSHERVAAYLSVAPDVFVIPHVVAPPAMAATLSYLMDSRATSLVVVAGDGAAQPCLGYLGSRHPHCAFAPLDQWRAAGVLGSIPDEAVAPSRSLGDEPSTADAVSPFMESIPMRALPWPERPDIEVRRLRRRLGLRGSVLAADSPQIDDEAAGLVESVQALSSGGGTISLVLLTRTGEKAVEIPSLRRVRRVLVSDLDDVALVLAICDGYVTTGDDSSLIAATALAIGVPVLRLGPAGPPQWPTEGERGADAEGRSGLDLILRRVGSRAGDPRRVAARSNAAAEALRRFGEGLMAQPPSPDRRGRPSGGEPLPLPRPVAALYRALLRIAPSVALALRDWVRRRTGRPPATTSLGG